MVALLLVLALILPLPGLAQEAPPPPEPAAPAAGPEPAPAETPPGADGVERAGTETGRPPVDEVVPPEPAAPVARPSTAARSPRQDLIDRAIRYYEQTEKAPPEVGAYLASNPALGTFLYIVRYISSVLIWLFLFLLIGMGGRKLLRPIFGAPPADAEQPRGYARGEQSATAPPLDRRAAIAETVAWVVALAIACEAVGLTWFGALWSGLMELASALIGAIIWLGLLIALAALVVWSFSTHGRRLVLSLLGWFYLKHSGNRPPEGHVFTLPDGREATIVRTDPLHSVMQPTDGGNSLPMPNADLMEQYYNWAAPQAKQQTG